LLLSVGGLSSGVSTVQNDLTRVDGIQIGFLGGLGLQSAGSAYLDDFSSQWATPTPTPGSTGSPTPIPTPTVVPTATPICTPYAVNNGKGGTYTNNCDGTVTDSSTGLVWERKQGGVSVDVICTDASVPGCDDPHNPNNRYSWSLSYPWPFDGTAKTLFLDRLNCQGAYTTGCTPWLGRNTWRLPTILEFSGRMSPGFATGGIVDRTVAVPLINRIFGPTPASDYNWSSSVPEGSPYDMPYNAWSVSFLTDGYVFPGFNKLNYFHVRAVRNGP
ncbi:MAG: hypothetical protein RL698_2374, partial [Pseudomonadota bacterium]